MESISYSSLIPPNIFIVLAMIGVIVAWRWRGAGLVVATAAMASIYLASLPLIGFVLMHSADRLAELVPTMPPPQPAQASPR